MVGEPKAESLGALAPEIDQGGGDQLETDVPEARNDTLGPQAKANSQICFVSLSIFSFKNVN